MTNQSVGQKKQHKKGHPARLVGAILLALGVLISVAAGALTVPAGFLVFAGIITLVVGFAQRNTEA